MRASPYFPNRGTPNGTSSGASISTAVIFSASTVTLTLTNQQVEGNIVVDSISKLTINMSNSSSFKGMINNSNEGEVNLTLDKTSTLTLTGNTYIKSLTDADSTYGNINLNGYKLYVNGVEFTK